MLRRGSGARPWVAAAAAFVLVLGVVLVTRYVALGTVYFNHPHEPAGVDLHFPQQIANRELWSEGLPTWNPWLGFGTPQLASLQSSVLYPLSALYLLFPARAAAELTAVLRLLAVGLGCLAFGRGLGLGAGGALFLSLAFTMSAWEQRYANDLLLSGDLLLPWMALSYLGLAERGRPMLALAAVALTALHVLAGLPESTFFATGFCALLYLFGAFLSDRRETWGSPLRKLAVLGAVCLGATALAGVQVLPFLEYLPHSWSPHHGDVIYGSQSRPRSSALALAYPLLKGTPKLTETGVVAGSVTLLFAVRGLGRPPRPGLSWFLMLLSALTIAKVTGLEPLRSLGELPLARTLAFAQYTCSPVQFSLAAVAGIGFDDWLRERGSRHVARWLAATAILIGVWLAAIGDQPRGLGFYPRALLALTLGTAAMGILFARRERVLLRAAVVLALLSVELWLHEWRLPWNTQPLRDVFGPILAGERQELEQALASRQRTLFAVDTRENLGVLLGPCATANYSDAIVLDRYREYRSALGRPWGDRGDEFVRLMNVAGVDTLVELGHGTRVDRLHSVMRGIGRHLRRTAARLESRPDGPVVVSPPELALSLPDLQGGRAYDQVTLRVRRRSSTAGAVDLRVALRGPPEVELAHESLDAEAREWRLLRGAIPPGRDALGLELVIRGTDGADGLVELADITLGEVQELAIEGPPRIDRPEFRLFDVPGALPRAYVAQRARVVPRQGILAQLKSERFVPGLDVLLEAEPSLALSGPGAEPPSARIVRSEAKRVTVEVSGDRPGILVLNDSFYTGWRARVDGVDRPVLPANLLFRGIEVEAGEHTVEFRYQPASVRVGLFLSVATLAALITAAVGLRVRARRSPS